MPRFSIIKEPLDINKIGIYCSGINLVKTMCYQKFINSGILNNISDANKRKQATAQFNYHISVDGMLYSIPYEYVKRKVDVRITDKTIEVFNNHNRITSYHRLYGRKGQYTTIVEHTQEEHHKYLEWNGDRFRKCAERIGYNTCQVVDG